MDYRCAETQRKCKLLQQERELEKEKNRKAELEIQREVTKNEAIFLQLQRELGINEGKRLALQEEKEKRITLLQQQRNDREEAEKTRKHEITMQAKFADELRLELKIEEQRTEQMRLELQGAKQRKHIYA